MALTQESLECLSSLEKDGSVSRWMGRVEIDTSVPFVSVKEAVDHFGGKGYWKPQLKAQVDEMLCSKITQDTSSIAIAEAQRAQLTKDLIAKKRESLEVLRQLENTKKVLRGLNLGLQKGTSPVFGDISDVTEVHSVRRSEETTMNIDGICEDTATNHDLGFILLELKEAKLNLARMIDDLASVQSTVERLNGELCDGRISFEETHMSLAWNSAKIFDMEKELNHTKLILQLIKDVDAIGMGESSDLTRQLTRLSYDPEHFKVMAEAAECKAQKLSCDIERAKTGIMSAVMKLHPVSDIGMANLKAQVSELLCQKKSEDEDVKESGVGVEGQECERLLEEVIGKWLLESNLIHGHDDHHLYKDGSEDDNGHDDFEGIVQLPIPSIGEILKRKLMGDDEWESLNDRGRSNGGGFTLGELLRMRRGSSLSKFGRHGVRRQSMIKRRKFGLGGLSFILGKPDNKSRNKKRKQQA